MSNSDTTSRSDIIKRYDLEEISTKGQADFIEWFTGEDGADKDIIQARRQAVQAYPVLATIIYGEKEIREVVEKKKPLAPALAEYYEVDEKAIKRLQGKTSSDLEIRDTPWRIKEILQLEEKNFQKIKNNLSDFNILSDYAIDLYQMSIDEFLDTLSLQNSSPCKYIERMKENSFYDVYDAFHFLREKLFLPALFNRIKDYAEENNLFFNNVEVYYDIIQEIMIKDINIKNILDFSERYHRNLFRWDDMFSFDSGIKHISWQPMFDNIDLGSGWAARELSSVKSLKEQGYQENHCVGGYFKSILKNDKKSARLIFSLEKEGQVKSTIDILCFLNEEEDGCDVEIQQNRAHSNENPCKETLNFSHLLIKKTKAKTSSKLNTYLDGLKTAREEYKKYKTENRYISACGYNPWDRDILENVWDEFKPVFPAKLRRLGLDGFIDMIPLDGIRFRPPEKDDPPNPWDKIENETRDQINRDDGDMEIH